MENRNEQELTEEELEYMDYLNECFNLMDYKKTIWKMYTVTPPIARFTLQIVDEASNTLYDSVSFLKDEETEKKANEQKLRETMHQVFRLHGPGYPFPRITCEFTYGFSVSYTVKVHL